MAKLPAVFNASKHDGRMGFNVIPAGRYKMRIVKSEMKKTKDGKGQYANLTAKVVDGQHKGSVIFIRLNLVNQNDEAVRIAQNELATLCDACKKGAIKDTEELHGVDFYADVAVKAADSNYPESNVIKNYYTLEKGKAGAPKTKVAQQDESDESEEAEADEAEEDSTDEKDDSDGEKDEEEEQEEAPRQAAGPKRRIFGNKK